MKNISVTYQGNVNIILLFKFYSPLYNLVGSILSASGIYGYNHLALASSS